MEKAAFQVVFICTILSWGKSGISNTFQKSTRSEAEIEYRRSKAGIGSFLKRAKPASTNRYRR
jgi:hypothetical protein